MPNSYSICEIDAKINANVYNLDTAMRRIQKYIIKKIDPEFSPELFIEWCNSDTEKPLVINRNRYYWTREEK